MKFTYEEEVIDVDTVYLLEVQSSGPTAKVNVSATARAIRITEELDLIDGLKNIISNEQQQSVFIRVFP